MMNRTQLALVGLVLAWCAPAARAAEYSIDPAHSQILFKVKHLGISTVTGRFERFSGAFDFDPASGKAASAAATIEAASISTNVEKRDEHLKSPDFLSAAEFPTITFASKQVTAIEGGKLKITGDLTMRGVTKPVVLEAELSGTVTDPWGNERAAFAATTTINRQDFGLAWHKALESGGLVAGNEVRIELEIEGIQKQAEKAGS